MVVSYTLSMAEKTFANLKRNRRLQLGVVIFVVIVSVTILSFILIRPERSVASYCKTYGQEKNWLAALSVPNGAYPSATFDVSVNDASRLAESLKGLDRVAPKEIEPMVKTLQQLYQKVHDDPSQDLAASISGESIDNSLMSWTSLQCGN